MSKNFTPPTQAELDAHDFIVHGILKDAAFQLARLEGDDLLAYARTFAALAQTSVDNQPATALIAEIARLTKEVEELRKDKERLDWFENNGHRAEAKSTGGIDPRHFCWVVSGTVDDDDRFGRAVTLRDAIDAAMQQKGEE